MLWKEILMNSKEVQLYNYINSLYLPKYFVRDENGLTIRLKAENISLLVNQEFSFDELNDYVQLHETQIIETITKQLLDKIYEPTYFPVEDLIKIQSSDEPFSKEDLLDLLKSELHRPNQEMNVDVIKYCLDEITRTL